MEGMLDISSFGQVPDLDLLPQRNDIFGRVNFEHEMAIIDAWEIPKSKNNNKTILKAVSKSSGYGLRGISRRSRNEDDYI